MSNPYVGEIRLFAGNFAPSGWAFCAGQLLPISENEALFSLIGFTYGGDGETTFALPDMRGRAPVHQGQGPGLTSRQLGARAGTEAETLTVAQTPAHRHAVSASVSIARDGRTVGRVPAQTATHDQYSAATPTSPMAAESVAAVGGGQHHENMQPHLALHFIISLFGIFPSQT